MSPESTVIFTDGSSRGNPGPGGFGAVLISNGRVTELGGRENYTTNNRMELTAALEALRVISNYQFPIFKITLYADSSYLVNGITKWVHGWRKNGWKTAGKQEVENRDLWERLIEVTDGKKIEWKRIDGHSGVAGNERCDEIATAFADGENPTLYSGNLQNYRMKNILDISRDEGLAQAKRSHRARSNGKPYSYVSSLDGKVVTHATWAECEARVKGVRGAKYQKAFSPEEEVALKNQWSHGR